MNIVFRIIIFLLPGVIPYFLLKYRKGDYYYPILEFLCCSSFFSFSSYIILNFIKNFKNIICGCNYKIIDTLNYIFYGYDKFRLVEVLITSFISIVLLYFILLFLVLVYKYILKGSTVSKLINFKDTVNVKIRLNNNNGYDYVGKIIHYNYFTNNIVMNDIVIKYNFNNNMEENANSIIFKYNENVFITECFDEK